MAEFDSVIQEQRKRGRGRGEEREREMRWSVGVRE
jgi:hypothetical protein